MTLLYILAGLNALLLAAVIFLLLKPRTDNATVKIEANIENVGKRLTEINSVLVSEIGRVREENKESVMKMFTELQDKIHLSLSDGRGDIKTTLESLQKSNELKLEQIRENVETKLTKSIERSSEDFQKIAETFARVNENVKTFAEIGKDISSLTDILGSPKLRGNFGEFTLESIVSQVIPESSYRMQHTFGKVIVDCVIKVKQHYLCIDSKFPLENYKRAFAEGMSDAERDSATKEFFNDVKKHITAIKDKYIIPEKTLDFAFMFVPAEAVYYELIKEERILNYAFSQKVIPVSPNTFFAYLNIIAIGFKGMKIEEEAKQILATLKTLNIKMGQVKQKFDILGKHIDNAKSAYTDASGRILEVENTVAAIDKDTGSSTGGGEISA